MGSEASDRSSPHSLVSDVSSKSRGPGLGPNRITNEGGKGRYDSVHRSKTSQTTNRRPLPLQLADVSALQLLILPWQGEQKRLRREKDISGEAFITGRDAIWK
jgi:hypothetical protein